MMEALRNSMFAFFKHLIKHRDVVSGLLNRSLNHVEKIRNFSEQLFYVKRAEVGDMPIGNIPGIKDNLLFKIGLCVEDEITKLQQIMEEFQKANAELEKLHLNALKSLEKIGDLSVVEDQEIICNGSPTCPSYLLMIEWIQDFNRLYHVLYIKFSMFVMNLGVDESFRDLDMPQMESEELDNHTKKVLRITTFFREEK